MPRTTNHTPETKDEQTNIYNMDGKRGWLVPALLGLIALFLLGLLAQAGHRENRFDRDSDGTGMHSMMRPDGRNFMGSGGVNATQNSIRGVVTAVNGSTFTVAGGGATNQVETNGSTQYQNGSQVKVNDSIVAFGTTNNGKFTATQVIVNP